MHKQRSAAIAILVLTTALLLAGCEGDCPREGWSSAPLVPAAGQSVSLRLGHPVVLAAGQPRHVAVKMSVGNMRDVTDEIAAATGQIPGHGKYVAFTITVTMISRQAIADPARYAAEATQGALYIGSEDSYAPAPIALKTCQGPPAPGSGPKRQVTFCQVFDVPGPVSRGSYDDFFTKDGTCGSPQVNWDP